MSHSDFRGAVILLHGLTGNPSEVEPLASALRLVGYDVRVPTLAGHSGDVAELRRTRLRSWLDQVESELRLVHRRPCFVVGLSFGALLGLHMAVTAKGIDGLVLISPTIALRSRWRECFLRILSYLPEPLPSLFGYVEKRHRPEARFVFPRSAMSKHSIAALLRLFKLRRRLMKSGAQLTTPTMLLADPYDHHLSAQGPLKLFYSEQWSALKELVWYPGGEHELTIGVYHQQLAKAVIRFLDKH